MKRRAIISGIAAPLPRANIDTDQIIPKVHLISTTRAGLGAGLFSEWRFDLEGRERPEFIMNREPFKRATILLAGPNFGCGSSREHAVWALMDHGIECVIAASFASIFDENAFNNGFATLVLPELTIERLQRVAHERPGEFFVVDLEHKQVRSPDHSVEVFDMDEGRQRALIEGSDEISRTLARETEIADFQAVDRLRRPWVWNSHPSS